MPLRRATAVIIALVALVLGALAAAPVRAQERSPAAGALFPLRTVFWFSNYDPARTVWSNCQIYPAPKSHVRTATQVWQGKTITGLPIASVDGTRALILDTTNPAGSARDPGSWNIYFLVGAGAPVNLKRVGPSPILRLRVRWGKVLPGNAGALAVGIGKASLPLAAYVTPAPSRWQDVTIPLADFQRRDPTLDLTHVGPIHVSAARHYDSRSVVSIAEMAVLPSDVPTALRQDLVKVDQSGWRPHDPKRALLAYPAAWGIAPRDVPSAFVVRDMATRRVVYTGRLVLQTGPAAWNESGDTVYAAEFDKVTEPGRYQIEMPGMRMGSDRFTAVSPVFTIGETVYDKDFRDAIRYYYYERSGHAIVAPYGEGYTRPAEYPNTVAAAYHYAAPDGHYHYTNPTRDVLGGWCDAGDPSLQVGDHAVAAWWLLEALHQFGGKTPGHSLNLPESTAAVSDLAPLVDYGLRWMTKMCNPDGSVLNTVAWANGKTEQITDIDSPSAALAAGAFAKACAVLKNVPGYRHAADGYLALARRSWAWLQAHPGPVTGVTSPAPVDPHYDAQCRAFAAVELFNATGESAYNWAFLTPFRAAGDNILIAFGGSRTGYPADGVMAYLNGPLEFGCLDYVESRQPTADRAAQRRLKTAFLHQADLTAYIPTGKRTPYIDQTPYHFAMLFPGHLYWGSNANVLSVLGVVLMRAYAWTGKTPYRDAALENLHFIQGRNPVDRDFVSGEAADYIHGCDFYSQLWLNLYHQPPGVLGAFISVDCQLNPYIPDRWKRFVNFQEASSEEPDIAWNCEYAALVGCFATHLPPVSVRKK